MEIERESQNSRMDKNLPRIGEISPRTTGVGDTFLVPISLVLCDRIVEPPGT